MSTSKNTMNAAGIAPWPSRYSSSLQSPAAILPKNTDPRKTLRSGNMSRLLHPDWYPAVDGEDQADDDLSTLHPSMSR